MTTPFLEDGWLQVYQGDCRAILAELPAASVHTVVTSPPYWGLRDYGTASWTGGTAEHEHEGSIARTPPPGSEKQASKRGSTDVRSGDCSCGAKRLDAQLGLEPTPDDYVETMVDVFREVARVLRPDGTVWLNLGDSFAGTGGYSPNAPSNLAGSKQSTWPHATQELRKRSKHANDAGLAQMTFWGAPGRSPRLKPKDLVGIPWRVAFALQADGWYLRDDVIWSKPNAMPESVTDRPTRSHEYVFLLSRRQRYFYDADAVAEASTDPEYRERGKVRPTLDAFFLDDPLHGRTRAGLSMQDGPRPTRNLRTVWTIPTEPYGGAHFATFPRKLVEPCIRASTSERGVCPVCGEPWRRVVEKVEVAKARQTGRAWLEDIADQIPGQNGAHGGLARTTWSVAVQELDDEEYGGKNGDRAPDDAARRLLLSTRARREAGEHHDAPFPPARTIGWKRACAHDEDPVPAVVLDPFAGSGTTGFVAQQLHRRAVLIDLSADYLVQAIKRNRDIPLPGLA